MHPWVRVCFVEPNVLFLRPPQLLKKHWKNLSLSILVPARTYGSSKTIKRIFFVCIAYMPYNKHSKITTDHTYRLLINTYLYLLSKSWYLCFVHAVVLYYHLLFILFHLLKSWISFGTYVLFSALSQLLSSSLLSLCKMFYLYVLYITLWQIQ